MTKKIADGRKKFRWIFVPSIFFVLVVVLLYSIIVVNPIIFNLCEARVDSQATTALSDAIFEVLNDNNIDYSDIVDIKYDSQNKVSSISSNVEAMNYIARQISTKAQIYLDEIGECGVDVNLGAFTGLEIFMNVGPKIYVATTPIGSVITVFNSTFESVGINQTRHSISVDVNSCISIVLPTSSKKISLVTSMLVCESVIVGEVPSVYLSSDLKSSG